MQGEQILKDTRAQKSTVQNVDARQVADIRAQAEEVLTILLEETNMSKEVFEIQCKTIESRLASLEAMVEGRIARLDVIIQEEEDAKKELLKLLGFT